MILIRTFTHSLFLPLIWAVAFFTIVPAGYAEIPADQIKAAGAIPLTTELLDKMDKVVKALTTDAAAKAELTAMPNDPNQTAEGWGAAMSSKCPKVAEHFKSAGITPEEFMKAITAMMAVGMAEGMGGDLAKSADKTVAANAAFVAANKARTEAIFGGFMTLGEPASSSPPASTP